MPWMLAAGGKMGDEMNERKHHHKCPAWYGNPCNYPFSSPQAWDISEQQAKAMQNTTAVQRAQWAPAQRNAACAHSRIKVDCLECAAPEMLELLHSVHWEPLRPGPGESCVRCGGQRIEKSEVGGYSSCALCRLLDRFPRDERAASLGRIAQAGREIIAATGATRDDIEKAIDADKAAGEKARFPR